MAAAQKFMFDLDFDDPDAVARAERGPEPEPEEPVVVEPEIIVPTFSEEELAEARKEGHAEGFEAGRKEAAAATEEKLLATVQAVAGELANIHSAQLDANREIAKEMISVASAIAKKMFPDLNARNALGEVERVVQETLSAITEEPRVQIMVPPDLRESFMERLATMTNRAGFDGKVFVNPDPGLNPGDCRIEWSNGAAVRDSDALWEKIDEIVRRNIYGDEEPESESLGADAATAAAGQAGKVGPASAMDHVPAPAPARAGAPETAADAEPTSEEMFSDQRVDAQGMTSDEPSDSPATDPDGDGMNTPAGRERVDPLSPATQAAILDADFDADGAGGADDELTLEQET